MSKGSDEGGLGISKWKVCECCSFLDGNILQLGTVAGKKTPGHIALGRCDAAGSKLSSRTGTEQVTTGEVEFQHRQCNL